MRFKDFLLYELVTSNPIYNFKLFEIRKIINSNNYFLTYGNEDYGIDVTPTIIIPFTSRNIPFTLGIECVLSKRNSPTKILSCWNLRDINNNFIQNKSEFIDNINNKEEKNYISYYTIYTFSRGIRPESNYILKEIESYPKTDKNIQENIFEKEKNIWDKIQKDSYEYT